MWERVEGRGCEFAASGSHSSSAVVRTPATGKRLPYDVGGCSKPCALNLQTI